MSFKINEQQEQPLLSRTFVKGVATFEGSTPSRIAIRKDIASQTKAKLDVVVLKTINTNFGKTIADVEAYIYKTRDAAEKIEIKSAIKKNDAAVEKKEEPKEEVAPAIEEKPTESPKEAKEEIVDAKEKPAKDSISETKEDVEKDLKKEAA